MHTVTKERYLSSSWLKREWEEVWTRTWQVAAHTSDLAKPGDYLVFELGPESILLTCTDSGKIAAYYNVCQHRGMRLVYDCFGNSSDFRCPYHSWRYDTAGDLIHAPLIEGFQQGLEQMPSLRPVLCEQALGFIWIALDPGVEPLEQFLEDLLPLMEHYEFENMTLVGDQTVSLNCNWKAVIDNFSELYHVPYLHPQHRRFVDCSGATNELYPRGHSRVLVPGGTTDSMFSKPDEPTDILSFQLSQLGLDPSAFHGKVEEVQDAIRTAKRQLAEKDTYYDNFSDEELSDVLQTNVFPNCIFSYQPEMLWLIRPRPHPTDPDQCFVDKLSFERYPAADDRPFAAAAEVESIHAREADTGTTARSRPPRECFDYTEVIAGSKSMTDTIDQDLSLLAKAQLGMHSAGFTELVLNEAECRVSHFHQHLDALMQVSMVQSAGD